MSELFRKIDEDFGGSISWNTRPICRVLFSIATALLLPFFLTFCLAVLQPGDAHKSTFPQICNHSRTCRTSTPEDAIFHRMTCARSFEVILARQSSHFPTWASASRTSGSRCIFHTLLRRRSRRRMAVSFCTLMLIRIVSETATVSFQHCPLTPNNLLDSLFMFYPLVLDHFSLASKFFFLRFCSILFTIVFNL